MLPYQNCNILAGADSWSWEVTVVERDGRSDAEEQAVRDELSRILASVPFRQSQRRQRFLKHIVNETLAGRSERLTGYHLALEIFGRPATFDPAVDPFVRIEAARLREKLREYYDTEGQHDPIRIQLPKGTYTPQIEFLPEQTARFVQKPVTQEASAKVPSVAVLAFDDLSTGKKLGWLDKVVEGHRPSRPQKDRHDEVFR